MADTPPTPLATEELHWGVALRFDIQEIRQDVRDIRREATEFRKEVAQQFTEQRREVAERFEQQRREAAKQFAQVAEQFAEQRWDTAQLRLEMAQGLRHNLMVTIGLNGVVGAVLMAFLKFQLAG